MVEEDYNEAGITIYIKPDGIGKRIYLKNNKIKKITTRRC